jgi:hypothetical protein
MVFKGTTALLVRVQKVGFDFMNNLLFRFILKEAALLMVVSVRKWLRRLLFAVMLFVFTVVMYGGCRYIAAWIAPADPYRVPQGNALKVFKAETAGAEGASFSERLKLFYWYGE